MSPRNFVKANPGLALVQRLVSGPWALGIGFLGVGVLGGWLRLHLLGRLSLWQDEIHTALYVNDHPSLWTVVVRVATWDLHSPLYYVLLRMQVWIQQSLGAPLSDGHLRLLSAWLGTLALAMIFLAFYRMFRKGWLALLAMALAAGNIYGVYYSQELRMYSLILLLGPAVLYFRLGLWDVGGRLRIPEACGYVLASVALLYSSLVGIFLVFGVWLGMMAEGLWDRKTHPGRWRQVLALGIFIFLAYLPWLGVMWRQSQLIKGGLGTGMVIDQPRELFKFVFENLLFHQWKLGSGYEVVNKVLRLLMPLAFLNLLDPERRRTHGTVLLALGLTFIIYFGLTLHRPFHTGRYFSPWWPFAFYLMVAPFTGLEAALARWAPKARGWAFAGLALLVLAYGGVQLDQLKYYYSSYEKECWRQTASLLPQVLGPNDWVLAADVWMQGNYRYYGLAPAFVTGTQLEAGARPCPGGKVWFCGSADPREDSLLKPQGLRLPFREAAWPETAAFARWHLYVWEPEAAAAVREPLAN